MVTELDNSYAFRGVAPFPALHDEKYSSEYQSCMQKELTFFRARVSKRDDVKEEGDIVNLPFDQLDKANDARFSISGKSCLYLGTTSLVCAEEVGWIDKENINGDKLYLAEIEFNEEGKKLQILNLAISEQIINGLAGPNYCSDAEKQLQRELICFFPLVLATAFHKRADGDDNEKCNEYLLSQFLMEIVKEENGIDGVTYLSCQGTSEAQYPQGVNLAIPVNDLNSDYPYGKIEKCYKVTKPFCTENISKLMLQNPNDSQSYICATCKPTLPNSEFENFASKVDIGASKNVKYQDTEYAGWDNWLVGQTKNAVGSKGIIR